MIILWHSWIYCPTSQFQLPAVLAFSETFPNQFNDKTYIFSGHHSAISNFRKDNSSRGGVALYIRENIDFIERPDLDIFIPTIVESVFVTLNELNITVGVIYSTSDSSDAEFLKDWLTDYVHQTINSYSLVIIT